ncbi:glycerate kinase [Escherichia coli]|nr:glycerate kinase [Escherichia coli]EKH3630368.1 glycerate kinase [Escherichia coli]EKH4808751.1 glycerate kinase [Escherichia coli]EKQ0256594.1 glycerate kinase [Escherichia coli]ELJ0416883.1 glycerate kinase [Escherichia coli]
MKIVIAPDSFKESLSAEKCCQAIKAGFSTLFPDANYICLPIADGGEGTVDAMVAATGGNIVTLEVCGPMGEKVNAFYGLTGDGKTAVIEMAAASGLMLVAPEKRNPLLASSFGTGELIRHALDNGIRHIILGIGGSATVDGGMGMAQALGVRFNVCQMAGGGAAGGMGIAAAVFLNADIKPGIEIVLNAVNLAQAVQGAALVITGEGRIDSQTAGGKAPLGVASVAKQFNVPVIGIAGVLGDGVEVVHQYGIDAVFSILPRLAPLAEVLASGETNLFNSARNIACAIKIGQGIKN